MAIFKESEENSLPWKKEFFKNTSVFESLGLLKQDAEELLKKFLKLIHENGVPQVLDVLSDISKLPKLGTYTEYKKEIRTFMIRFLSPFMSRFQLEGEENLKELTPLIGKFPVTIVANHLSHFDAAALFMVLYNSGGLARELAEKMVFIAGRPVFQTNITRAAVGMLNSLLVCSRKDLIDNVGVADVMTKVNMRSFRHSYQLQKNGKIIVVFPEGTRSRTGQLLKFVDAVYHYISNRIVIPISLTGTDKILPTNSFLFQAAEGRVTIDRPVFISNSEKDIPDDLPDSIHRIFPTGKTNKKAYCLDSLAILVGKNLDVHRHGTYRNLYKDDTDRSQTNELIQISPNKKDHIVIIGNSNFATAIGSVLANKEVKISIYIMDPQKASSFNAIQYDLENYPFYKLPPNIRFTSNPDDIKEGAVFIQAVQPWNLDSYYRSLANVLRDVQGPIVNIMKGFTSSEHHFILSDLNKIYGVDQNRLCVLAGSNYADQIMERKVTGFELAAQNSFLLEYLLPFFNTGYIFTRKAIIPEDVKGVQIGGALRIIYAIIIGVVDGYYEKILGGNNDSTLFHLFNVVFAEMVHVGVRLGGKKETFYGLSGLSDLMLSCFGLDSRDRHYGHELTFGRANPLKKSSGIASLNILVKMLNVNPKEYPLLFAIARIIIDKEDPGKIFKDTLNSIRKAFSWDARVG